MATKGGSGPDAGNWRGGRIIDPRGYVRLKMREHPRANVNGYVWEHIAVVEAALGKPLPPRAEIHHVDEDKSNNAHGNLVVCPDRAYHMLLHKRAEALAATGNPDAHRCRYCSGYDHQEDMRLGPTIGAKCRNAEHARCARIYRRDYRRQRAKARQVASG